MKYKVLDSFKAQTNRGEMKLQSGQIITLSDDKAIKLLNQRMIKPVEKVAYKIFSEILQAHLWVVDTEHDMKALRSQGKTEAIYTHHEISELKKMPREDLRAIHNIKETFPESTIEQVKTRLTNIDRRDTNERN